MNKRYSLTCLVMGLSVWFSGCQHGLSQPSLENEHPNAASEIVSIRILEQSALCPMAKSGITQVNTSKQWSKILATSPLSEPVVLPKAWLENYRLFAVSFGAKPSAGYSIQVAEQAQLSKGDSDSARLIIIAALISPEAGSISAQMITSPCVLVGAPMGDYQVRLITP